METKKEKDLKHHYNIPLILTLPAYALMLFSCFSKDLFLTFIAWVPAIINPLLLVSLILCIIGLAKRSEGKTLYILSLILDVCCLPLAIFISYILK